MNIFLKMEINATESFIKMQEEELKKVNSDWSQGFHEGLKLANEQRLEGLKQIQREEERLELQRISSQPLAR